MVSHFRAVSPQEPDVPGHVRAAEKLGCRLLGAVLGIAGLACGVGACSTSNVGSGKGAHPFRRSKAPVGVLFHIDANAAARLSRSRKSNIVADDPTG